MTFERSQQSCCRRHDEIRPFSPSTALRLWHNGCSLRDQRKGKAMRIRRTTLGYLRVFMVLGLARAAGAQTPDPVDTRSASVIAQPPPVAVKSTREPAPLGVDGQLTPWLQIRGEFRARAEGFTGGGFADNSDAYWMDRSRLNATASPTRSMKFVVQLQDARAFDKTIGSQIAPLRDTLD